MRDERLTSAGFDDDCTVVVVVGVAGGFRVCRAALLLRVDGCLRTGIVLLVVAVVSFVVFEDNLAAVLAA